jgi:hypothetical protein
LRAIGAHHLKFSPHFLARDTDGALSCLAVAISPSSSFFRNAESVVEFRTPFLVTRANQLPLQIGLHRQFPFLGGNSLANVHVITVTTDILDGDDLFTLRWGSPDFDHSLART